jgi:hypothetical protein
VVATSTSAEKRIFMNSSRFIWDFFISGLAQSGRMSAVDEAWLSLLLVALFGFLLFLRLRFPNASRGSETAVLVAATILFFSICNLFPRQPGPSDTARELIQTKGILQKR